MREVVRNLLVALFAPLFLLAALLPARRTRFVWGGSPLISNKYWSAAVKQSGRDSLTLMEGFYHINQREDFDLYFEDFAPAWLPRTIRMGLGTCLALAFVLHTARVVHISYDGFALGRSALWRMEGLLFRLAGIKVIVMPYGGDAFIYSRVIDISVRHGLLASYPALARAEGRITRKVDYWNRRADAVLVGPMVDGMSRWDVPMNQIFVIDVREWQAKGGYSANDGRNGPVTIIHTPNHRGVKGTEFLVEAVRKLRDEGLLIELVLLERASNEEVRRQMLSADILAEQFLIGYGFSAIEGMASGLAVMSNLDNEAYTRIYRRFSFLNECPILSTSPETMEEHLRVLVTRPELREELGRASRHFAEKYHSYETAQYLFGAIYENLLEGGTNDLMRLFHPLSSQYSKSRPDVRHPLVENRLPRSD